MPNRHSDPHHPDHIPVIRKRRRLYRKLVEYRKRFYASLAGPVVLGLVLVGFVALDEDPQPRRLGAGTAGVMLADTSVGLAAARDTLDDVLRPPAPAEAEPEPEPAEEAGREITGGAASYYGDELAGRPTASGETFDPGRLTAAHRTLPFGTRVRVTNEANGESVVVRINDRGPFHGNRVIDLSVAAARQIGLLRSGTGRVRLQLLPQT